MTYTSFEAGKAVAGTKSSLSRRSRPACLHGACGVQYPSAPRKESDEIVPHGSEHRREVGRTCSVRKWPFPPRARTTAVLFKKAATYPIHCTYCKHPCPVKYGAPPSAILSPPPEPHDRRSIKQMTLPHDPCLSRMAR